MNAANILAALDTVEQDHQLVLDKVKGLKEIVSCLLEPETDYPGALGRLRDLNCFFATAFETHLLEEESTLFSLLQQHLSEGDAVVKRLQDDHTEIRRRLDEFDKCLSVASETEDHPRKMVVRDLLTFGWELCEALDDHARLETQTVRQCVIRFWSEVPARS